LVELLDYTNYTIKLMINYAQAPSPSFLLDESRLRRNLELIRSVQERAGVSVILALKGFFVAGLPAREAISERRHRQRPARSPIDLRRDGCVGTYLFVGLYSCGI
jgi:hypothetical protein